MSELREPDEQTLESLYNINKHAKRYAGLADKNYHRGKKGTAKANSLKKKALYAVKSRAINRFLLGGGGMLVDVERHQINGDSFLCLDFIDEGERWSFHQPEVEVIKGRIPSRIEIIERDPEEFEHFESDEEKERSDKSLKDSLLHLETCGWNANDYLEQTHVQYGSRSYFVGWKYLGETN